MNYPADGVGALSGSAAKLQVSLDQLNTIALNHVPRLQNDAHGAHQHFQLGKVADSAFSPVPDAQTFATQQAAAHAVLSATLVEVSAQLEKFQANLKQAADSYSQSDDDVKRDMAMQTLQREGAAGGKAINRTARHASDAQGTNLVAQTPDLLDTFLHPQPLVQPIPGLQPIEPLLAPPAAEATPHDTGVTGTNSY